MYEISCTWLLSLSPDNRLEEEFLFEDSFNPPNIVPKSPTEPPSHKVASSSDSAPVSTAASQVTQSVPVVVKTEVVSPVCTVKEEDTDESKPTTLTCPLSEDSDPVGGVKLGKRSGGERSRRVDEFLEGMAKVKKERLSAEDSSAVATKICGLGKEPQSKKARRYSWILF